MTIAPLGASAPAASARVVPLALADGLPMLVDGLVKLLPRLAPELRVKAVTSRAADLGPLIEQTEPAVTVLGDRLYCLYPDSFWNVVARCSARSSIVVIGSHVPEEGGETAEGELRSAVASGAAAYVPRTAATSELATVIRAVALGYRVFPFKRVGRSE